MKPSCLHLNISYIVEGWATCMSWERELLLYMAGLPVFGWIVCTWDWVALCWLIGSLNGIGFLVYDWVTWMRLGFLHRIVCMRLGCLYVPGLPYVDRFPEWDWVACKWMGCLNDYYGLPICGWATRIWLGWLLEIGLSVYGWVGCMRLGGPDEIGFPESLGHG